MYRPAFKSRVDIQVEQLPTDPNHPAEESYKQFGEGSDLFLLAITIGTLLKVL